MKFNCEPERAIEQGGLPELLAALRTSLRMVPDATAPPCAYLAPDEVRCLGEVHELRDSRTVRRCAGSRIRTAAITHAAQLRRCGADPDTAASGADPVPALVAALRALPDEKGLHEMLGLLREVLLVDAEPHRYHLVIRGQCGTGKTHCLLVLFFHALRTGQRAVWTTWTEWRTQAQRAESFDPFQAAAAGAWFMALERADLVVIDDVLFVGWSSQAERARVLSRLGAYLERRTGRTLISTNLNGEIRADEGLGERVYSRLTETRVLPSGVRAPVRCISRFGTDQRGHL